MTKMFEGFADAGDDLDRFMAVSATFDEGELTRQSKRSRPGTRRTALRNPDSDRRNSPPQTVLM